MTEPFSVALDFGSVQSVKKSFTHYVCFDWSVEIGARFLAIYIYISSDPCPCLDTLRALRDIDREREGASRFVASTARYCPHL